MNNYKIIALFGKSGAGKDYIQHWMLNNISNCHKIISYTTRLKRDYEIDNKDYHFCSENEFKKLINNKEMLESTDFNGWLYGTAISSLEKNKINIGVFNPQGVETLININKNSIDTKLDVFPLYIDANDKLRLYRNLKRESNPNCIEICRRFLADEKDFKNINFNYETYDNNWYRTNHSNVLNNNKLINFLTKV